MSKLDPAHLQAAIQDGYLRYFDTAFWLRDDKLMAERRKLLQQDGNVFQDALIEPVPTYPPGPSILEVCDDVGFDRPVADRLAAMLFGSDGRFQLWSHQARSLHVSLASDDQSPRNVIVTSGTGSGKTESFLLPVFARLAFRSAIMGLPAGPQSLVDLRSRAMARLQGRGDARGSGPRVDSLSHERSG